MKIINKITFINAACMRWRLDHIKKMSIWGNLDSIGKANIGRVYHWNDILFSSTFNEIIRSDQNSSNNADINQYNVSLNIRLKFLNFFF